MLHSNERIIRHKVGLLNLADELGDAAKACKMMGVSRDTFYRYKEAAAEGGVDALLDKNRRGRSKFCVSVEKASALRLLSTDSAGRVSRPTESAAPV